MVRPLPMASERAKLLSAEIIAAVKENSAKLGGCMTPHDFVRIEETLFSKYRCTKCSGTLDCINAHWYQRGLADAKKT